MSSSFLFPPAFTDFHLCQSCTQRARWCVCFYWGRSIQYWELPITWHFGKWATQCPTIRPFSLMQRVLSTLWCFYVFGVARNICAMTRTTTTTTATITTTTTVVGMIVVVFVVALIDINTEGTDSTNLCSRQSLRERKKKKLQWRQKNSDFSTLLLLLLPLLLPLSLLLLLPPQAITHFAIGSRNTTTIAATPLLCEDNNRGFALLGDCISWGCATALSPLPTRSLV